jgi:chorismate mutase / prephenate dehydratase
MSQRPKSDAEPRERSAVGASVDPKAPRQESGAAIAPEIADELARLRREIDGIDARILEQLNQRARCVQRVGELKQGGRGGPIYVAARERDLVRALVEANPGPFPSAALPHVFREIISATRSLEERVRVAFLGPDGTFSHQAASRQFGAQVDLVPVATMRDVFVLTERGDTHFGVVPVENTIEGPITVTFDALVETDVTICSEIKLEIAQNLMSRSGRLEDIQRVASHPQPLAQCRRWLETNLAGIETVETTSTAAAAQLAHADPKVASIGSQVTAEVYDLLPIASNIQDQRGNTTRFLVIGRETPAPSGQDLTSAVFTVRRDQAGALHELLGPFARHAVNLTAVQSRPMKGKPWEYIFIVDMEGHQQDPAVRLALEEAARVSASHKILGSFPRALEVVSGLSPASSSMPASSPSREVAERR